MGPAGTLPALTHAGTDRDPLSTVHVGDPSRFPAFHAAAAQWWQEAITLSQWESALWHQHCTPVMVEAGTKSFCSRSKMGVPRVGKQRPAPLPFYYD